MSPELEAHFALASMSFLNAKNESYAIHKLFWNKHVYVNLYTMYKRVAQLVIGDNNTLLEIHTEGYKI